MAKIFLYDEFNPEDNAMLQALYSRSPESVEEHVNKVHESGSGKFMEKFYVGYGHMSIADCGSTTLFVENLSILADKALQDWPLYSGQETSTRYVDMSKQPIIDPLGTADSKKILDDWMAFYISSQERIREFLRGKYPKKPDEDEKVYEKAIVARSFDIMRGFLPAGITTQLSWHTNLRQAWDKVSVLRHWPLPEVKEMAEGILNKLKEKYPHSFCHNFYDDQENFRAQTFGKYSYFHEPKTSAFSYTTNISNDDLNKYREVISTRPQKTNLPNFLAELGLVTFNFLLDYGSFRDIQRHRNGVCRMPLLTTEISFNQWYLDQLPDDLRQEALVLIEKQKTAVAALNAVPEIKQYYISLGFNVSCRVTYALPAAVYVAELRSMKTVHPTLRTVAHKMTDTLKTRFPEMVMHSDTSLDDWDVRRGLQDIVVKS